MVKNLPAMQEAQEMQVQFLGWEDPLEEEMATHSSILAGWYNPMAEGGLQSVGFQRINWLYSSTKGKVKKIVRYL